MVSSTPNKENWWPFDSRVAAQVALYFLLASTSNPSAKRMATLLYLADKKAHGMAFTKLCGGRYCEYEGTIVNEFAHNILTQHNANNTAWERYFAWQNKTGVVLEKESPQEWFDALSEWSMNIVGNSVCEYGAMNDEELNALVSRGKEFPGKKGFVTLEMIDSRDLSPHEKEELHKYINETHLLTKLFEGS